jgi:hypothetical protein
MASFRHEASKCWYSGCILVESSIASQHQKNTSLPTIESVRLADMCGVTGMETQMAEYIKAILMANPTPKASKFEDRDPDTNTYPLAPQHITSAALLPSGHPVRKVLAAAAVEGYVRRDRHKFLKEIREAPDFAVDFLMEIKETLKTVTIRESKISFIDPLSGKTLPFVIEDLGFMYEE